VILENGLAAGEPWGCCSGFACSSPLPARYFFLAYRYGEGERAVAAALAFAMMCALAAARLFGWLRQYTTEGDTNVPQGANPGQIFLWGMSEALGWI